MKRLIDRMTERAFLQVPGALSNFSVLPVLHVERLHQDAAFEQTLAFFSHYLLVSGHKAVATVIPPKTPMLMKMLQDAAFSERAYEDRLRKLAEVADIGLHGHYMRDADNDALVHNYWNEREIISRQMAEEIAWLESRGLMTRRIYSGGWWYCDSTVMDILAEFDFEFDFSFSTSYFNVGPMTYLGPDAAAERASRHVVHAKKQPLRIWAISDICSAGPSFAVPRHLLRAFFGPWRKRERRVVSLYGHDWDMNLNSALRMLEQLKAVGIHLAGLSTISARASVGSAFPMAEPS